MSELKWSWVYYPYLDPPEKQKESALKAGYTKVYLKSEADKVIAELQSKVTLASLADDCSYLRNKRCNYCSELQRQKYKRCLAMAEWCDAEADVADADGDYEDMLWYQKWHERWLELADKFKEDIK